MSLWKSVKNRSAESVRNGKWTYLFKKKRIVDTYLLWKTYTQCLVSLQIYKELEFSTHQPFVCVTGTEWQVAFKSGLLNSVPSPVPDIYLWLTCFLVYQHILVLVAFGHHILTVVITMHSAISAYHVIFWSIQVNSKYHQRKTKISQ